MPTLLALGRRALACLVEEATARPAVGRAADLRLLAPVTNPGKIICLAGNYQEHIREGGGTAVDRARATPHLFIKPRTCLAPPGATVVRSRMTDRLVAVSLEGAVRGEASPGPAVVPVWLDPPGVTTAPDGLAVAPPAAAPPLVTAPLVAAGLSRMQLSRSMPFRS